MKRETAAERFPIGSKLPVFSLKNCNREKFKEEKISSSYLSAAKAVLVIFTCNHCPYVKGSEESLLKILSEFSDKDLKTIAISSNDPSQYPDDSPEKMEEKSKSMSLPFPYLYDESQEVAKAFDAACTPECYLFDETGSLVYHGAINDSPRDPSKVTTQFLKSAIYSVLEGAKPDPAFANPLGCSIKWKN